MASSSSNPTPGTEYTSLDSQLELWYACAGELVQIPEVNSQVYYFVQGHLENAARTQTTVDVQNFTGILPNMLCKVEAVNYLAEQHTDEVLTRIQLRPLIPDEPINSFDCVVEDNPAAPFFKKAYYLFSTEDGGCRINLTRECAKAFFHGVSAGEYLVRCIDVHGVTWDFKLTYPSDTGGEPVLTTGWDEFLSAKRLVAMDYVIFMRDRNGALRVGVRRGQIGNAFGFGQKASSVVEAGKLALEMQPFEVLYYPRVGTPEFVVKIPHVVAAMANPWYDGVIFVMPYEDAFTLKASTLLGTVSSLEAADPRWDFTSLWRCLKVRVPVLSSDLIRVNPWMVSLLQGTGYSSLDSQLELWYAIAGEVVQIPQVDSAVCYFVQGHLEHACKIQSAVDLENVTSIPACILCKVEDVNFLAERQTDEVFTKIRLRPLMPGEPTGNSVVAGNPADPFLKKLYLLFPTADGSCNIHLTQECAKTFFPNVSAGEYVRCMDVHGVAWEFMLTYPRGPEGYPVLGTGWDTFVSAKGLVPKDLIIFMRDRNGVLRVGIRRARLRSVFELQVTDAGKLALANQAFTVLYYPRAGTPEFVVKMDDVGPAVAAPWTEGSGFLMTYEDDFSYQVTTSMGTVSSLEAFDPYWPLSVWRCLKVYILDLSSSSMRVSPWKVRHSGNRNNR